VYAIPNLGQGLQGAGHLRPGLGLLGFAEALKVGDGIVEAESVLDDAGVLVGVLHKRAQLVKRPAQFAGIGATVISPRFDAVDEGVTGRCDAFFIFGQEDGDIPLRQWWHVESRDWPDLPPMACHYHHGRTNQLVRLEE
jgi:hypothetical protein